MRSKRGALVVIPGNASLNKEFFYLLCIIISGILLGLASKLWDGSPIMGAFSVYFGIWVFAASMTAFFSNHPFSAVINVPFFFLAALTGRWLYDRVILGYFPQQNWRVWAILVIGAAFFGFIVWIAKGNGGYIRSVCAGLPASFLIAEGFPFSLWDFPELLNIVYTVVLLWVMNRSGEERFRTAGCAAILTLTLLQFHF